MRLTSIVQGYLAWIKEDSFVAIWITVMIAYSIFLYPTVLAAELDRAPQFAPEDYRTYFAKFNWYLYPLFFLLVYPATYHTWHSFLLAWRKPDEGAPKPDGAAQSTSMARRAQTTLTPRRAESITSIVRQGHAKSSTALMRRQLTDDMQRHRIWAIVVALIASAFFCYHDTKIIRSAYFDQSLSYEEQGELDADPDFFDYWLFDQDPTTQQAYVKPPRKQILVAVMCYFQEFNVVALGFLLLCQIVLQIVYFGWFNKLLNTSREHRLTIMLNHKSTSCDFDLTYFNYALDRMYWMFGLALLVPILSYFAQPDKQVDAGQVMGRFWLFILLALPFALTIFVRRKWVRPCQERARMAGELNDFKKQRVWPFDKNHLDKVGILVCLFLYFIFLGVPVVDLLRGFLKSG